MVVNFVPRSMQDVIDRLGGVPLFRIGTDPPPGLATEADVLRHLESSHKRLYELVDGTLVEKPMGWSEGVIANFISRKIGTFVDEFDLGIVNGADGPVRMTLNNLRVPDVSFFENESLPEGDLLSIKVFPVAPALAIEVLSESNTPQEIEQKRLELFRSGTRLMWVIDPHERSAEVFTSPRRGKVIDAKGILDGGKVLPGFRLSLQEIFDYLDQKQSKRKGRSS